jgi:hypothetical protein
MGIYEKYPQEISLGVEWSAELDSNQRSTVLETAALGH